MENFEIPELDPQQPGTLNLSGSGVQSSVIPQICEYLAKHPDVTKVDLSENPIGYDGAVKISEYLKTDQGTAIASLNLSTAEMNEEAILAFCENAIDSPSLQQLVLDSNGPFTPVATHAVGNLLINSQSLTELSLNDLQLDDSAATVISQCVMHNTTLTNLSLEINLIEQAGAQVLGEMLVVNTTLKRLDLGLNRMRAEGAALVLSREVIEKNTSLTHVNLSRNWLQSIDGVVGFPRSIVSLNLGVNRLNIPCAGKIARFLQQEDCSLRLLYLGHNLIGNDGVCVISDALTRNTTLQMLDVSENMITASGVVYLGSMLCTNTTLRRLLLSGNAIGEEGFEILRDAFEVMNGLRSLELENCGIKSLTGSHKFSQGRVVVDFDPLPDNDDSGSEED
eukprot:TRINITY_DN31885_c0_g1_i1.p1 TRINITY_DN31885_c0_g1~~TRINITY_DN31885_c0_g1_i1.p1  ORF type:complete len:394 (-),score=61.01 TRINITY_DN31885_c0_g1_i1:8-1189(-)